MAYAREIMQGGFSAISADAIQGGVNLTVAGAGTTQGTATQLVSSQVQITSGANTTGVILFAGQQGDWTVIFNTAGNSINVYPPLGAKINQIATNSPHVLANNTVCVYHCFSATQWVAHLST